ncbi:MULTISPECIES: hypothetical protein [unclassified Agrobacterium]|nr:MULTISPECIES: hypothetical protein [unclassified Agrobacterium]KIV60851.1 hypothetical protein SZ54_5054 [Rhizobium sp. UR51a]MBA8801224.1 hypothetical protein [Agrobacterium sp. RC10-4-1]
MRLILAAMIASVLSILAFKYADHSIGYSLFLQEAGKTEGATPLS